MGGSNARPHIFQNPFLMALIGLRGLLMKLLIGKRLAGRRAQTSQNEVRECTPIASVELRQRPPNGYALGFDLGGYDGAEASEGRRQQLRR
jgi:hypothetical protein